MLFYYILVKTINSQVFPFCSLHSDCQIGYYCGDINVCYTCSYISPDDCDALNENCCTKNFLHQCPMNPYECALKDTKTPPHPSTNHILFMFNLIFLISCISYLSVGCYRNKYLKQKEGIHMLPNYNFWTNVMGLVKDGIVFSYAKLCKKNMYSSME